jgi:hypothetical protein
VHLPDDGFGDFACQAQVLQGEVAHHYLTSLEHLVVELLRVLKQQKVFAHNEKLFANFAPLGCETFLSKASCPVCAHM